jgi:hypothetical protein
MFVAVRHVSSRVASPNSRLDHLVVGAGNQHTLALQWRIDDRKALLVLLEGDVGNAERFAQLVVRHFHWAR